MTGLLLAEHDNKALSEQTAKALTAAARIATGTGSDVHVLAAGMKASKVIVADILEAVPELEKTA